MPKPRTATELLEARGAFKRNPSRRRDAEPQPAGEFPVTPPSHLTAEQQREWFRIAQTAPPGVLKSSDVLMVELASCLLAEFVAGPYAMPTARIARLERQLSKFGLSPADRAALTVSPVEVADEF